jgi:hypothetical protein
VSGIAPVIEAVNVILRRLGNLPDGPEVSALRDRALECIEEVVGWNAARPSSESRNATMVRILGLHVAANKAASGSRLEATLPGPPRAA